MSGRTSICVVVVLTVSLWFFGCAASGNLVVVPSDVAQASVPEGKFQDVHAVYLYNIGYVHFDPVDIGNTYYPAYAYSQYAKIKLLTRAATEGYHYGNIFVRHLGDLLAVEAAVIKPDGSRKELGKSDFLTNILVKDIIPDRTPAIHFYETVIVFPGLEAGDVIEYHYTKRGQEPIWYFTEVDAPVMFSKFMIARPKQRAEIQPVIYDRHNLKPEYSEERGMATGMFGYMSVSRQATYDVWVAKNVPAILYEPGIPPETDLGSGVYVWQADKRWDWATLGNVYYKWFTQYGRFPAAPKELADKITQGISDPKTRAKAIYKWVKQNINIVPMDQISWVPRELEIPTIKISKVLEEKTATPEQIASLMWLMLQAVGVEATLVLSTDSERPEVEEGLPDVYQFSHPLLALPDGTLLDTTQRLCSFGMVPWGFEGRKALWVKGTSVSFKDIPVGGAEDNKREVFVKGSLELSGEAKVEVKSLIRGQMALAYRRLLVPMSPKEREGFIRDVAVATAEKADVDDFAIQNLEDVEQPLEIGVKYHAPGYADMMKDRMVVKTGVFLHHVACPVLKNRHGEPLEVCPKPVAETRQNPVKFLFKRLDEIDAKITFPLGYSLQTLPKSTRTKEIGKGTLLGVQTGYESADGKSIHVVRKFSINDLFVSKESYDNLRDLLRRFLAEKDTLLTLELPKLPD
jgi:hypothetical protein